MVTFDTLTSAQHTVAMILAGDARVVCIEFHFLTVFVYKRGSFTVNNSHVFFFC